ncbi:hypothetical protein Patl1_14483 [Pistacia atlantica]|uniref:Uncharacterized protein n=1 Tax=Pistacia atlantica TaxID=434234 RepID=A0ACC1AVQ0_9ROSI|nr:hypothetical protein Patl1_14483 [Pistacia atlantica]
MASDAAMEKMQLRQSYQNMWHTDLLGSIKKDTPFMCYRNCRAPVGQDAEGKTKYVIRPVLFMVRMVFWSKDSKPNNL